MHPANGSSHSGNGSRQPETRDGFVPAIESLRGLAALMVAGFHALIWLDAGGGPRFLVTPVWCLDGGWQAFVTRWLLVVFNGGAAVTLFFVLSGFVLHASLQRAFRERNALRAISAFMALRVVRLMPAYAVSLVVMVVALRGVGAIPAPAAAAGWLAWFRLLPPDLAAFGSNLLLLRVDLNPVAWTLRIEMFAFVMLAGLYLLARAAPATFMVSMAALLVFAAAWPVEHVGRYAYLFALGLACARWGCPALRLLSPSPRLARAALCVGAVLVLLPGAWTLAHEVAVDAVSGLGAALVICVLSILAGDAAPRLLRHRSMRWLGRISFSFYLLHFAVLYVVCGLVLRFAPAEWMQSTPLPVMLGAAMLALPLAAGLAGIVFSYVEQPALRAARAAVFRTSAATSAPRHRPR